MIKILFDHQKFTTQRYGGISRYFATLINAIEDSGGAFSSETGVLYTENQYLSNTPRLLGNRLFRSFFKTQTGKDYLYKLNKYYSRNLVRKNSFDIFHPTYYDPYFLPYLKKPLVTTIHDMTYEILPEYFWAHDPLTEFKRMNIERADAIIAISETTKSDLLEYGNVSDPGKIKVIYHGIDVLSETMYHPVSPLPENYILYVGDRSGYKNFFLFMDACREVLSAHPSVSVVLTGGGSIGIAEKEYLLRNRLAGRVCHINASDAELNYLFSRAMVFVYPSLHEGFGLPILEAFKAGCPVLLSDTRCFREVGAGAVHYFEATSKEALIAGIYGIIGSEDTRRKLIAAGRTRLRDFPIEACINKTFELYRSLA